MRLNWAKLNAINCPPVSPLSHLAQLPQYSFSRTEKLVVKKSESNDDFMFLPLELLEVLLLSLIVVDAPNAIVVAIEGGENGRTEYLNI